MQQLTPDLATKVVQALGSHPLLVTAGASTLQELAFQSVLVHLAPGEPATTQGEAADTFVVVLRGALSVRATPPGHGDNFEVDRLKPPDVHGEVDVLMGQPRRLGTVAVDQALLLQVPAAMLKLMFERSPAFGIAMSRHLATRLLEEGQRIPLPYVDLAQNPPQRETVELLPRAFIERQRVLPVQSRGNQLLLGCVDELNAHALQVVATFATGMELLPVRIDAHMFNQVLEAMPVKVEGADSGGYAAAPASGGGPALRPDKPGGNKPLSAPKLDALLKRMVAEGASDLHLSANHRPRWRIDGEMREIAEAKVLNDTQVWDLIESGMADRNKQQFLESNDTDFAYALPGVARFRCNLFRDMNGIGLVARVIPSKILTFEQLGLPEGVRRMCDNPKGLVLVTGPTGSGKSTTLAAMVDYINRNRRTHIITLEDPIEFVHPSQKALVNQREVGPHTTSFARALKACLREDPDIILVGEMRDLETIALALETANTGHLVFGTLHTSTAISTVDRIIDVFPSDQQSQIRAVLSDVLKGVVAQTLLKKRGGGRVAALEVLVGSHAVANLVREGKNHQIFNIMLTAKAQGNQLLNEQLERLVTDGKVDYDEAIMKSLDKAEFAKRFGKEYFEK
jgi:twitching motility protein PilT